MCVSLPTTIFSPSPTPSTQSFFCSREKRREKGGGRKKEVGDRGRSAAIRFHTEGSSSCLTT